MTLVIVSDKVYNRKFRYNFEETYHGDVALRDWSNVGSGGVDAEVVVLDLDLSERTAEGSTTVPLIKAQVNDVRERFNAVASQVPGFIEEGKVIIGLLDKQYKTVGLNQPTNYDWLDHFQVASRVEHEFERAKIEVVSEIPAVHRYFNCVDGYQYGIRLNEEVVSQPEILAQHAVDRELVAVALDEYMDPNNVERTASGYVVLLPQPSDIDRDFYEVIQSLEEMGQHFVKREKLGEVVDEAGEIDIDQLIESGESEIVEFKQALPNSDRAIPKEIVGLANQRGGVLVVGIADDGTVVGVDDVNDVEEHVTHIIRDRIDPAMSPSIKKRAHQGEDLLVIEAPRAERVPYNLNGTFYRRIGTTTKKLSSTELGRWYS